MSKIFRIWLECDYSSKRFSHIFAYLFNNSRMGRRKTPIKKTPGERAAG
jgi:hypothetical protein